MQIVACSKMDVAFQSLFFPSDSRSIRCQTSWLHTWRRWGDSLILGSPARRAWQGAQLLQAAGVADSPPSGCGGETLAGVVRESFYVSEALLTQVPLNIYWRERQSRWSWERRCAFLRTLAEFFRTLHASGSTSATSKTRIFLSKNKGDTRWKFYIVDLDRVTQHRSLHRQRRFKNMTQLERTLGRIARMSERLFSFIIILAPPCRRGTNVARLSRSSYAYASRKTVNTLGGVCVTIEEGLRLRPGSCLPPPFLLRRHPNDRQFLAVLFVSTRKQISAAVSKV